MTSRTVMALTTALALCGALRFGIAVHHMPHGARGDYAATLPGAYVKAINPVLWSSPDLQYSYVYHRDLYVYGPAQYLLLYPTAFLDSYAQIANVLGYAYAGLLAVTIAVLARVIADGRTRYLAVLGAVAGIVLLFPPIYQVYIQREFEIVALLCLVLSTYLLIARRDGWAGALMGFIAWFKLWPVAFAAYFLAKRQYRALAAFVFVSCLTLGLGQLVFGLDRFMILSPSAASSVYGSRFILASLIPPLEGATFMAKAGDANSAVGQGFCGTWYQSEQTAVGVRWAICRLAYANRWLPAPEMFYAMTIILALAALCAFIRIQRKNTLTEGEHRWSTIWEMSLVTMGAALMLSAHYYYFVFLTLPLTAMAYHLAHAGQMVKLAALGGAYCLLSVFLIPLTLGSSVLGIDLWRFYVEHAIYLYGEIILVALVLWEYTAIGLRESPQ